MSLPITVSQKQAKSVYLRQSNALTTAAYTLSRNEKRLVYLSLEKIFNGSVIEERGRFDVTISHTDMLAYSMKAIRTYRVILLRHLLR